tara:strand:- start:324 stop:542 length:219 start_codon:yes stop_codon:yes gene_type:complete
MDYELFTLNGYGKFVWPAFIFTFLICLTLYLKTRKSLKKQEKIFLKEYGLLQSESLKEVKQKRISKEVLSAS